MINWGFAIVNLPYPRLSLLMNFFRCDSNFFHFALVYWSGYIVRHLEGKALTVIHCAQCLLTVWVPSTCLHSFPAFPSYTVQPLRDHSVHVFGRYSSGLLKLSCGVSDLSLCVSFICSSHENLPKSKYCLDCLSTLCERGYCLLHSNITAPVCAQGQR